MRTWLLSPWFQTLLMTTCFVGTFATWYWQRDLLKAWLRHAGDWRSLVDWWRHARELHWPRKP